MPQPRKRTPSTIVSAPELPRVNQGDFEGLKEAGVSANALEVLKKHHQKGGLVTNLGDLSNIGISESDAALIATNATLSKLPKQEPKTVELKIQGKESLIGVVLSFTRLSTGEPETIPIVIGHGDTTITFDEANKEAFTVTARSTSGDPLKVGKTAAPTTESVEVATTDLATTDFYVVPPEMVTAGAEPSLPTLQRMRGKVVSTGSDLNVGGIQLVIQVSEANSPKDSDYVSVAFAETESSGYFVTSPILWNLLQTPKSLTGARAILSVDNGRVAKIGLTGTALPERVILSVDIDQEEAGEDADCKCGDSCSQLNFYQKKALDEFSYYSVVRTSEPLIESFEVATIDEIELDEVKDFFPSEDRKKLAGIKLSRAKLMHLASQAGGFTSKLADVVVLEAQKEAFGHRVRSSIARGGGRVNLGVGTEVDWDEKPTIYQAVSVAHGHLLHFKQEWFSDGYSIGDLLYSLPLAPGQKKNIVVFDWDRRESASNTQQLDYQESLYHSLSRDRDIQEVAFATVRESSVGKSVANTSAFGGGIGVGAIIPIKVPIGVLGGVAGGSATASSVASQNSARTTTANSQQSLSDRTHQASNMVRSQRSTVIQTVSQGERFEASSEVVANYNHCHAMTVQYFEVLRHLQVRTRLADVQECLFVPMKMSPFTAEKALRWRGTLVQYLVNPSLRRAFDALARVERERSDPTVNYYDSIGIPSGSYAEEELVMVEGELNIEFQILRPYSEDEAIQPPSWAGGFGKFIGSYSTLWHLHLKSAANRDEVFASYVGPHIARALCDHIQVLAVRNGPTAQEIVLPTDATLMSPFRHRVPLNVSLRMSGAFANPVRRQDIDFVKVAIDQAGMAASGLDELLQSRSLRMIVHSGSLRYRTRNLHEVLFNSRTIRNDLTVAGDSVRIFTPLSAQAMRKPRQEDVELSNELLQHLNENLEYYHQCLWTEMDPQRRFMLLDGIVAPGRSKGKSVASVVENRLIGIAGNCLILPVSPGNHLDPSFDENVDLFEHYYSEPLDPISISLPTKGVYAEAVMGKCNSCEYKDEERFWRWEEAPIPDSPTSFNPISVPTPVRATPDLNAKDFPSNVISIQTPLAAPDPQGFTDLVNLLGKGDLFRDLTGLSENQKNALASLKQAFSTAEKFGEGAKDLTTQAAELYKFNQYRDMLKTGQIGKDDFKELTKGLKTSPSLEQVKAIGAAERNNEIDSDSAKRLKDATIRSEERKADPAGSKKSSLTDTPGVGKALERAAATGESEVELKREGDSETVKVKTSSSKIGLFGSSSASKRINAGSTKEEASDLVHAFVPQGSAKWKIDWTDLKGRLLDLIRTPKLIAQEEQNLCGPAAFFVFWFTHDPKAAAQYALTLYQTGKSTIGGIRVEPSDDSLIAQDYQALRTAGTISCRAAEWMMMGALRDSENLTADYDGDGSDTVAGITWPGELQSWFEATMLYRSVVNDGKFAFTRSADHALALQPSSAEDIVLLINARMIDRMQLLSGDLSIFERLGLLFPNHYVILEAPIIVQPDGKLHLQLWSWGQSYVGTISVQDFEDDYYGAVIARG